MVFGHVCRRGGVGGTAQRDWDVASRRWRSHGVQTICSQREIHPADEQLLHWLPIGTSCSQINRCSPVFPACNCNSAISLVSHIETRGHSQPGSETATLTLPKNPLCVPLAVRRRSGRKVDRNCPDAGLTALLLRGFGHRQPVSQTPPLKRPGIAALQGRIRNGGICQLS
jgi:hypothetical protein